MATDIKISELNEISSNKTINQLIVNDRANSSDPGITRKISISNLLPTYDSGDITGNKKAIVGNAQLISTQQAPGLESVNTNVIRDSAITEAKIASQAVTSSKIATGTIINANIADNTILGSKISPSTSVTVNSLNATTLQGGTLNVTGNTTFNTRQYTWPNSYTSDRYLRVDGAGNLSWSQPIQGSGTSLVFGDVIPIGAIMPWTSISTPTNYLLCDGSTFDGTQYPGLSAILGTTYGPQVGNLFRLPNLKGKVPVGSGTNIPDQNGNLATWTLGASGGEHVHTLTTNEMPSHLHTVDPPSTSTGTGGGHSHTINSGPSFGSNSGAQPGNGFQTDYGSHNGTASTVSDGQHSHSVDIGEFNSGSTGSGSSHNNIQPYLVTNYIIKALPDPKINFSLTIGAGLSANTSTGNIDLSGGVIQARPDFKSIGFDNQNRLTLVNQPVPQIVKKFTENSNNGRFVWDGFAFIDYEGNVRAIGQGNNSRFGTEISYAPGSILPLPNNLKADKLYATDESVFIITPDRDVYALGYNVHGQLGIGGTTATKSSPTKCALSDIVKIVKSSDREHHSAMALDIFGDVYSFGANDNGELGTGNTTDTNTGTPYYTLGYNGEYIVDVVAAGGNHSSNHYETYCAFDMPVGKVYMVGYGGLGQMANNTTTAINSNWITAKRMVINVGLVELTQTVAIYAGGSNNNTAFYALSAGNNFSLSGGTLWGWGYGGSGNLGQGNTSNQPYAVSVATRVLSAWVGGGYASLPYVFVKRKNTDGSITIYACGENNVGQLGIGNTTDATTITNVTSLNGIDIERIYTCGTNNDSPHVFAKERGTNRLFAAGYNAQGQLGLGDTTNRTSFTEVHFNITSPIIDIYCEYTDTIGGSTTILTADGQVYRTGVSRYGIGAGSPSAVPRTFFARVTSLIC